MTSLLGVPTRPTRPTPPARPGLPAVLRRAWDQAPIGLVVIDSTGRVHYTNPILSTLAGMTARQIAATLQGRGPGRLLDARGVEVALGDTAPVLGAAEGRRSRGNQVQLVRSDGSVLRLRCDTLPLEAADGRPGLVLVGLLPGRAAERGDDAARLYATRAQVMAELAKELAEGLLDVEQVTQTVARRIAEWRGDLCIVSLLDADRETLSISACAHPDPQMAEFYRGLESQQRLRVGEGMTGGVVATGRPVVLQSLPGRELLRSLVPKHRSWFRDHAPPALRDLARQSVSMALLPLRARGEILGAMAVGAASAESTQISDEELMWLQEVADVCALAIANARLYKEASDRLRVLQAARRVDLAMVASLDLRLTLDLILEELTSHLGVDAAAILLAEGQSGLHLFTTAGFRKVRAAITPHRLSQEVFALGHAVRPSPEELDDFLRHNGIGGEGIREAEFLPLIAQGHVQGVLQVFRRSPSAEDAETRHGIESIAIRAALAIEAGARRRALAAQEGAAAPADPASALSAAQLAVFRMLVEGLSNKQIASRLHLSENTVKTHLRGIFNRLGVNSRLEAVMTVTSPLPAWADGAGPEITRSGDAI